MRISALDSAFKELLPNLAKTSENGGWPHEYVYFLTRQGVARLIALFCCNFFLIFLQNRLENHAKWRMLYMSHMVCMHFVW